ncbi:zf-CCHC domain-containing protein [Tanacetum coccineum]|uniref:Zf-CCHC domain-containing protein n=1 Tax=Tanacetum coccineum TaxID=301880 RepID=A0ABQ4WR99_9ASTR
MLYLTLIITILKALDDVSLAITKLGIHEVVIEKDSEIYRGKKERVKSIALKAKKESSDDETLTSGSDDEEYAMAVRNFKKFFRRKGKFVRQPREEKKSFRQRDEKKGKSDWKCFRCGDPNHLIGDCPKPSRNKDQKAFIGGSWSDSENDAEDKTNDETCLMAQSSNEVTLNSSHYSDNASSLDNDSMQIEYNSLCEISLKIINKNKILKTKRELLEKEILELNEKIKKLERSKEIEIVFHEMIIKKDFKIVKAKGERKSLALKAKKESSDEESLTSGIKDEEDAMVVRDFKKFFKRRDPNHLIGECLKPSMDKNQRAFVGGSWSDSGEEDDEKTKDETCLMAQASSEICLGIDSEPDELIKDSGCFKHMTGNRKLFSTYKAYNGEHVDNLGFNLLSVRQICDSKYKVIFSENDSKIVNDCKVIDEEETIKVTKNKNLENDIEDETLEVDKIVNVKESKNHPLENVIENLNQEPLGLKLKTKELVPHPKSTTIIGTKWVYRNKLDENGVVSRNKARILSNIVVLDEANCSCNIDDRSRIRKRRKVSVPTSGPYQTNPPSPDDIKLYVQIEREDLVTRIRHDRVIDVERKPRKDYGTKRDHPSTFASSSSAFGQPTSSHHIDDDNDGNDEEDPFENPPPPPPPPMDDQRTMAQLLEAPIEGYENAIVVPEITADNFELKHDHFYDEVPERPDYVGKAYAFPIFPRGGRPIWLEKEPPRSILTWDDLDRFNDLLRACPHHGFLELHQLDTFYNALNSNDQDSLNSAAGGNFLDKMPRDCLRIIESKFKVRNSRNKPVVAKVSSSSSTPGISPDVAELKDMVKALLLDKKSQAPTLVKAVEESCVTCGGAHSLPI